MQTLLNNCSPAPALYESIIELATTVLFMAVANYRSRWSQKEFWFELFKSKSQLGVGGVSSGANWTRNRIQTLHLVQRHLTGFSPMVLFWGTAPKPVHLHNWIVFARFSLCLSLCDLIVSPDFGPHSRLGSALRFGLFVWPTRLRQGNALLLLLLLTLVGVM